MAREGDEARRAGYKQLAPEPAGKRHDALGEEPGKLDARLCRRRNHLYLWLATDLVLVSLLFLVPERTKLKYLSRFKLWDRIYDFDTSTLDLWLVCLARCAFFATGVFHTWRKVSKSKYGGPVTPVSEALPSVMFALTCLSYVFLFAKYY